MITGWQSTGLKLVPSRAVPLGEVYGIDGNVVAHPTTIGRMLAWQWCMTNLKTGLRPRKVKEPAP